MSKQNISHRLSAARTVQAGDPTLTDEQCFTAVDTLAGAGLLRDEGEWQAHTGPGNHLTVLAFERPNGDVSCSCEWNIDTAAAAIGYGVMSMVTLAREIAEAHDNEEVTGRAVLAVFRDNADHLLADADENLSEASINALAAGDDTDTDTETEN